MANMAKYAVSISYTKLSLNKAFLKADRTESHTVKADKLEADKVKVTERLIRAFRYFWSYK